ncbi:uncharacterized protein F4807DRAFT_460062 [Annulohypoxylon truncatum]|uniref:uncharacterized protein n=1 Tax=Annulohypoxylon truncatum TaxID=327061 RepID=UPI0020080F41|nr:uncharacterized protein F4807DRAFT_460062 [Annulohypoxylon truncatum]KAI1210231.1 hypothetical protein F4807DRAFT_460062 [Annulohypoxylon truncatum]
MSDHRRHRHRDGDRQTSTQGAATTPSSSSSHRGVPAQGQTDQIADMVAACRGVGVEAASLRHDKLIYSLRMLIDRCHLFLSIPTRDKLQYLQHLRQSCQNMLDPDGSYRRAARILPGVENFVRSIRTGQYNERRDGNWFTWWRRTLAAMARQNYLTTSDLLRYDQNLIRHLVEYEIVDNNNRADTESNQLPPISPSRQTTGGPLPSVNEILRQSMSGRHSNPSWGSSSSSNAGSSSQRYSSRGHSNDGHRRR